MVIFRRADDPSGPDDDPDGAAGSARLGDPETVARIAAGDVRALGVLYDRFGASVYSLARSVCGGPAAAEEVTREVFLALRRGADRFDPARGSVATWVLTTARHHAVRARRRTPGGPQADGATIGRVADLTPEQRIVVDLAYVEGYTTTEIARITNRSAEAVLADVAAAMTLLHRDADDPT